MSSPIICLGQQPCGIFPRRFLFSKFQTARRLQREIGGEIVFFYHDSDHDPRETMTILRDLRSGEETRINFQFANKLQKQFSPLFAKRVLPEWKEKVARQLPNLVAESLVESFKKVEADNVADFCLEMYRQLGLLAGMQVARSGDGDFRRKAIAVDDYFVDVKYEGELVRARRAPEALLLHKGGNSYIKLPLQEYDAARISPTRDTRLRWMQSVVQCTHYVAGASEVKYLNTEETPGVQFVTRDEISESDRAYLPDA
ncbi:MAG: cytochrome P450 [Verrucomicrobiota bacterium]|nr:cytochrome P450 [Verrucomicrobiota bacterium]